MTSEKPFRYLSGEVLERLEITAGEIVGCMQRIIMQQGQSRAWSAPKSVIQPGDGRYMMSTLSAGDEAGLLAVKSVVLNPDNSERGLPQINGLIMLLDARTGVPVAVLDGNWITAMRTAGASALVARRLARTDARCMAFIGCGVQARSHLALFRELFPLERVAVYGRGRAGREAFAQFVRDSGLEVTDYPDPQQAVRDADILVSSVTMSMKIHPFIDPRELKPGAFVAATDAGMPFMPQGMDAFHGIVIDDLEQEAAMPEPMVDPGRVSTDLNGLVAGAGPARGGDDERYAFIFRAVALGDLALSALVYDKARALNLGQALR